MGLALCLAIAAGLVTMIAAMGGPAVRTAFRQARPGVSGSTDGRA